MQNGNGYYPADRPVWIKTAPENIQAVKVTTPQMLAKCWPYVRERLEHIKKKDKSSGYWLPEHVRHAVFEGLYGRSLVELYLALDESGVIHGFIVTSVRIDPFVNLPLTLWIWAGWLNRDLMERLTPWLEQLARERGLTGVEFESGRFGWIGAIRRLMNTGFVLKQSVYRMEVH